MFSRGVRVIRGQDWIWGDQDGGAGCVGTVCELGQLGSKCSPDKTAVVCWDCGLRSNYRTGYQAQYDLAVIDNAQGGVKHPTSECNSCKQNGVVGMLYKCGTCADYNLCSLCYHSDKHNLEHPFIRHDSPISTGIKLTPRTNENKQALKGIFVGATVHRGHDWKWGNQDGGEGSTGIVTDICCWGNESSRSVACVNWRNGTKNDYRVGHNGIMDLKYITPAPGGSCYVNHIPVLGKNPIAPGVVGEARPGAAGAAVQGAAGASGAPRLSPGDRVRVALDADTLRHLQQGHGGWNPRMADYIGKVGIVHRVTEKGDIRVQHEGCQNRWTFHPAALVAVAWYYAGDLVKVISDPVKVRQLQRLHGEWVPAMESTLGKNGRVMNVYSDGDLRIQIIDDSNKRIWTLNPLCVTLVQRCAPSPEAGAEPPAPAQLLAPPAPPAPAAPAAPAAPPERPEMRMIMALVAQGNLDYFKEQYEIDNTILDSPYCGKTALQVAAFQGHQTLVQFLLSKGARPTAVDDDGDSVLHDAAFGNQPEILQILLTDNDVDINAVNRSRCSALHIAAHKCLPHCVWVLLQHKPNVNLQDTYGDTALHDAINNQSASSSNGSGSAPPGGSNSSSSPARTPALSGSMRIIQMLCDYADTNFALANKRGFNALQHAALKGNGFACAAICRRAPALVDHPKDDGFSALHLAALNGHGEAVNALVTIGRADLNQRNNRHQTPLLLSISQGHCSVIEQLVNLGCDIKAFDEDGNTALHIAFMKRANAQSSEAQKPNSKDCSAIYTIYEHLRGPDIGFNRVTYAICIFLIHRGCDPSIKNKDGMSVFDLMAMDTAGIKILQDRGQARSEGIQNDVPPSDADVTQVPSNDVHAEPMELTNRRLANVAITSRSGSVEMSDADGRATAGSSSSGGAPFPNSSREGAFGGGNIGVNVNASPSKRNYYNLLNYADLGECSSSNSSPVHYPNIVSRGAVGKTNNTSSPQHPVRPSRHKKSASPPASNTGGVRGKPTECVVCCELSEANCSLEPCGHQPACEDCSARMKKCLTCGTIIERRLTTDGRTIACRSRQPSAERLRYLECKIQEIEEAHCCPICMERRRSVAFLCGHGACAKCAATLATCHMCRQDITSKINLY